MHKDSVLLSNGRTRADEVTRLVLEYSLLTGEVLPIQEALAMSVPRLRRMVRTEQLMPKSYEVYCFYLECRSCGGRCKGHATLGAGRQWTFYQARIVLDDMKRHERLYKADMYLDDRHIMFWARASMAECNPTSEYVR